MIRTIGPNMAKCDEVTVSQGYPWPIGLECERYEYLHTAGTRQHSQKEAAQLQGGMASAHMARHFELAVNSLRPAFVEKHIHTLKQRLLEED